MSQVASLDVSTMAFSAPSDHDRDRLRYSTMCRLRDGDGAEGWGEASPTFEEAALATAAMLRGWAPLLVGTHASPAGVDKFLFDQTSWYGSSSGAGFAVGPGHSCLGPNCPSRQTA